jgi:hypothetical protein
MRISYPMPHSYPHHHTWIYVFPACPVREQHRLSWLTPGASSDDLQLFRFQSDTKPRRARIAAALASTLPFRGADVSWRRAMACRSSSMSSMQLTGLGRKNRQNSFDAGNGHKQRQNVRPDRCLNLCLQKLQVFKAPSHQAIKPCFDDCLAKVEVWYAKQVKCGGPGVRG